MLRADAMRRLKSERAQSEYNNHALPSDRQDPRFSAPSLASHEALQRSMRKRVSRAAELETVL
eukprot:3304914-Pleurochrysis_carterae.AAC.1